MDVTKFILILIIACTSKGQEEFDCKPKDGCQFATCDPSPFNVPSALKRNEYPITCLQKKNEVQRSNDRVGLYFINTNEIAKLKKTVRSHQEEIKSVKETLSAMTLQNEKLVAEIATLKNCKYESPQPDRTEGFSFSSQCYSISQSSLNSHVITNDTKVMACPAESVCLRMEAVSSDTIVPLPMKVTYGSCMPKQTCNFTNCDVLNKTMSLAGLPFRDCRIQCCDTDLCNNQPLIIPSMTTPTAHPSPTESSSMGPSGGTRKTRKCYDTTEITRSGGLQLGGKKEVATCEPDSQCYKLTSVVSFAALPGGDVIVKRKGCILKTECNANICEDTNTGMNAGMEIKACGYKCCDGDLCNT